MKKLFLFLLTVLLPMVAFADAVEIDGIYYNIISKNKGAEVTSNPNGYSGCVDIPASVIYEGVEYSVISIGEGAFAYCYALTSVSIPNGVTSIGNHSFENCMQLKSVTIPNSVTSIGDRAFLICTSLLSVTIPNGVTSIGNNAFQLCISLTSFTIPNSVTSIGNGAFSGCSGLTSITIPNSVTSIGEGAFSGCSGLTLVTIPNSVTLIDHSTFEGCSSLVSVTIPNSVRLIESKAFGDCHSLTSITIPNSVGRIGYYVFSECHSLASITIGSFVKEIGGGAFAGCPELIDVYCLAENVPSTNSDAFQGSYIEYATLHVPAVSVNAYKATEPWKNFKTIVSLNEKCATPTISYQNGQLIFESETEGVEYISEITDADIRKHYDEKVSLKATYVITVYATKTGYDNSDVATATLCWIDQQPKTEGITDGLAQIPARPVLIKTDRGQIIVEGVDDSTNITLITTDGKLAGSAISQNGSASIDTHLPSGTAAIVRIGEKSVKVLVK